MFQKLQLCSNWDWGQWEWGGREDRGVGGVDGVHILKEVSKREVVKSLISHIKYFEFHR